MCKISTNVCTFNMDGCYSLGSLNARNHNHILYTNTLYDIAPHVATLEQDQMPSIVVAIQQ